ncbi:XRE family transcriptional regulator [Anaerotruncus sp. 1XD22-93]|nr:XRE family transcriptional regulator [Lachnospiraceae bacterium]NBI74450.1 XRE family transcriptional regulator [Lachnospiraceae bacterium]RKJ96099.1 XRE family transcriptional regulator [Anaerotruncus sp. 1XD22-93]
MITYEPLWKTLQQQNVSQYSLINDYGFSTGTLDSLRQNKNITMKTLNDICNVLNCNVEAVIKHIPDGDKEE